MSNEIVTIATIHLTSFTYGLTILLVFAGGICAGLILSLFIEFFDV